VTLKSSPPGAQVWVNGRQVGMTPLARFELYPGAWQIYLRMAGYRDAAVDMQVQAGALLTRSVKLEPTHGQLSVSSRPTGARVLLAGQVVGETPVDKLPVLVGEHALEVQLDGYDPVQRRVKVQGGKLAKVGVKLASIMGKLVVTTTPSDASVQINGEPIGPTPLRRHMLPRGDHTLTLYKTGFEEHTQTISIKAGKKNWVKVRLVKEPPQDGALHVTSKPEGARIMMGNIDVGKTPRRFEFRKGEYVLRWMLDGFEPVERKIQIEGGGKYRFHQPLERAKPPGGTAELTLETKPKGAEVVINGRSYGTKGVKAQILTVGTYEVVIRKDGYKELTFQLSMKDRERLKLNKHLSKKPPPPKDGFLALKTTPPGATAVVNNVEIGTTPLKKFPLRPGFYTVQCNLPHHEPVQESFEVQSKRTTRLNLKLTSMFATLKVETIPPGAMVFLNGSDMGETPGTWAQVQPGDYELLVSKIGHREHMQRVKLTRDQTTSINVDLSQAPAALTIKTRPPGATVFVDGSPVGVSPLSRHSVEPGMHQLEVQLEGYKFARGEITLESKADRTLEFKLEKLPEPPAPPPPPPSAPAEPPPAAPPTEPPPAVTQPTAPPTQPAAPPTQPTQPTQPAAPPTAPAPGAAAAAPPAAAPSTPPPTEAAPPPPSEPASAAAPPQ